jgi:hypothetical protein
VARCGPTLCCNLPRRWPLVTSIACAFLLFSCGSGAGRASAQAYLPPAGKVFQGVAGQPISAYQQAVGKHPALEPAARSASGLA